VETGGQNLGGKQTTQSGQNVLRFTFLHFVVHLIDATNVPWGKRLEWMNEGMNE
jgi:hypothetical protein